MYVSACVSQGTVVLSIQFMFYVFMEEQSRHLSDLNFYSQIFTLTTDHIILCEPSSTRPLTPQWILEVLFLKPQDDNEKVKPFDISGN